MEFRMQKEVSFHFTLDEEEIKALYTLLQKLNTGYGNVVKEFKVSEDELNLVDWLDKHITHSDAYKELKLDQIEG